MKCKFSCFLFKTWLKRFVFWENHVFYNRDSTLIPSKDASLSVLVETLEKSLAQRIKFSKAAISLQYLELLEILIGYCFFSTNCRCKRQIFQLHWRRVKRVVQKNDQSYERKFQSSRSLALLIRILHRFRFFALSLTGDLIHWKRVIISGTREIPREIFSFFLTDYLLQVRW